MMSERMRALRLHEVGGPQNLRVERVEQPAAQGEAVVRIAAAAVNRRDLFITQGLYPGIALPRTLGSDGAGVVVELVASSSPDIHVGDEVVIDPMLGWGEDLSVWDSQASILGMPRDGTFAEFVRVPAINLHPKPTPLTMEEAAAIPLAGLTAFRATFTRGELRSGETVLIPGIGGGVQTFVLLFAKLIGARAIVTSGSDAKLERARRLGADVLLNYNTDPDWHKLARKSGPIDLVVDSSGGVTLAKALDAVRSGGRVVVYGGTTGDAAIKMFPLFWKHIDIRGTSMGSPSDFRAMLELFERGAKPVIDRVYPLNEGAAAVSRLATSEQFGKVVLAIQ